MPSRLSLFVAGVVAAVSIAPIAAHASGPSAEPDDRSGSARSTRVDLHAPQDLPLGALPQVAYIDSGLPPSPIFRPGQSSLAVGHRYEPRVLQVHGGYLVATVRPTGIRFVGDDGDRRTLLAVASPAYVADVVASHDGRLVAFTIRRLHHHTSRIVVRRVSDNEPVARHTFSAPVHVASFTRDRVLLTSDWFLQHPSRSNRVRTHLLTILWSLRSGRAKVIDDAGRPGRGFDYTWAPGDLSAGQVAVVRDDHDRVVTIPDRPARAWRTAAHERVQSWSPDDRYVLTEADHGLGSWDSLAIRRAGSGTLVTRFQGTDNLNMYGSGSVRAPVWESASTFVFDAGYGCDEYGCPSVVVVRCTVHGACERVAEPEGVGQVRERELPPS